MITIVPYVLLASLVCAKDEDAVVLQIKPETIIKTFNALKTSGYLKKLADEFALKTAEEFVKHIRTDKDIIAGIKKNTNGTTPKEQTTHRPKAHNNKNDLRSIHSSTKRPTEPPSSEERRSEQFMALMEPPPPDGDNLERETDLTDVEKPKTDKPLSFYKINGKHFRRFDFYWK